MKDKLCWAIIAITGLVLLCVHPGTLLVIGFFALVLWSVDAL